MTIDTAVVMTTKDIYLRAVTAGGFQISVLVAKVTVNDIPCTISDTVDVSAIVPATFVELHGSAVTTIDITSHLALMTPLRALCPVTSISMFEIREQDLSQFANAFGEIQFNGISTITIDTSVVMAKKDVYLEVTVSGGYKT